MKYNSLIQGGTYYTVTRHKMGNTTISTVSVHAVIVISLDSVRETVIASWNGNTPQKYYEHQYKKWRKTKPVLINGAFGVARLATREEIAKMKEDKS